jgi:hypothetical protein
LIAADEETIAGAQPQTLSPLVAMLGLPAAREVDVLNEVNAETYWERSDLFDMALDLTAGRRGLEALGKVIRQWITHLLSIEVEIEALTEAADVNLIWYVGLDAEATTIGDALWNDEELEQSARERIIGLYRLTVRDAEIVLDKARGEPIYLILAMTPDRMLRMKPQNLVTGLPIAHFGGSAVNVVPALAKIAVGIVVARRKADSPWIDFTWKPVAALAGLPDAAPWTVLSQDPDGVTFYAGAAEIELYRTETTNYRDNLGSSAPMLWVALRQTGVDPPYEVFAVTADPAEGEAWTEAGSDLVDVVPMPETVRATIDAFVAEHHVERVFHKRQRDRADPEALARRGPMQQERDE